MYLTSHTFKSVAEVLRWSKGNLIFMFCVKRARDIAAAIAEVVALNATDRVFLEIRVPHIAVEVLQKRPAGWNRVHYVAEAGSTQDVETVLSDPSFSPIRGRSLFMLEFDPSWKKWHGLDLANTTSRLHAVNVRTFAATSKLLPSVSEHVDLFNKFDVVYSYDTPNCVTASQQVNAGRGISPP